MSLNSTDELVHYIHFCNYEIERPVALKQTFKDS